MVVFIQLLLWKLCETELLFSITNSTWLWRQSFSLLLLLFLTLSPPPLPSVHLGSTLSVPVGGSAGKTAWGISRGAGWWACVLGEDSTAQVCSEPLPCTWLRSFCAPLEGVTVCRSDCLPGEFSGRCCASLAPSLSVQVLSAGPERDGTHGQTHPDCSQTTGGGREGGWTRYS